MIKHSRQFLFNALALPFGILSLWQATAVADGCQCALEYPFTSSDPRTSIIFNESEVLRAFSPSLAGPGDTLKVWYNDEHALTLGVRRVIVKTSHGSTTNNYPVSPLSTIPGGAINPQVGTTALNGDQSGTDTSSCSGYPDLCDRPMFPSLFVTDISNDPSNRSGDWQHGGTPIPPHAVFGTWKAAVKFVDKTQNPTVVSVTPDANPVKNNWNLGSGDPAPAGLVNQGYGAECRWNVNDLMAAGIFVQGHVYRVQFMVHDGDQNKTGGDAAEGCATVVIDGFTSCPPTQTVEAASPNGAVVHYPAPTTVDACGTSSAVSCSPPSGSTFPVGTTAVTCTMPSSSAQCSFNVTVHDTTPPTFTGGATDFTIGCSGPNGAVATFNTTASDNADPNPVVVCNPPSGSTFPVGSSRVTCTATDFSGNSSQAGFTVTIERSTMPPSIACPADVTVNTDPNQPTASSVHLGAPSVYDNCGPTTVGNNAPSTFSVGTNIVTWTATDASGNTASCHQLVIVVDNQPPSVSCSTDISVEAAPGAQNAVVEFDLPAASDNTGIQSIVATPASGSTFPIGTNPVEVVATDLHGNTATCTFAVIVARSSILPQVGPSDVDLYLKKGAFLIDWASHKNSLDADRLIIKGKMNPRGCTNDMAGATVAIRINGTAIAPAVPLTAKAQFTSLPGAAKQLRYRFKPLNGTYQFALSGVDLASLIGLQNLTASGLVIVEIEIEIQGAGLATPVVTGQFEFAYKSIQNGSAGGKFSFKKSRTLTGVFNVNKTSVKQTPDGGFVVAATGPILLDGSLPFVPTNGVTLTIGNAQIVIPSSSLLRKGPSDVSSVYTYTPTLGSVPGLASFMINNKSRSFRLLTTEISGTGLPMAGTGQPLKHNLDLSFQGLTDGGSMVFDSVIEAARRSPTSPSWKR